MPNTKAAKKALRQNTKRRVHNLRKRRELLNIIKDFKKEVGGEGDNPASKLPTVYKKLDKAAKAGLIKKNRASRLKSRLTKRLGGAASAPTRDATPGDQA